MTDIIVQIFSNLSTIIDALLGTISGSL